MRLPKSLPFAALALFALATCQNDQQCYLGQNSGCPEGSICIVDTSSWGHCVPAEEILGGGDAGQPSCGDAGGTPVVDAGYDAGFDAGTSADAGFDAGLDAGPDAGPGDAGIDAGLDAGNEPDAGMDAGLDAGIDAGLSDAGTDGGADAGDGG